MSDIPLSRRDALLLLGAGAAAVALPKTASALGRSPAAATAGVAPFALRDVRLLDGVFRDAQIRNARYLLSLEGNSPDRGRRSHVAAHTARRGATDVMKLELTAYCRLGNQSDIR